MPDALTLEELEKLGVAEVCRETYRKVVASYRNTVKVVHFAQFKSVIAVFLLAGMLFVISVVLENLRNIVAQRQAITAMRQDVAALRGAVSSLAPSPKPTPSPTPDPAIAKRAALQKQIEALLKQQKALEVKK